MTKPADTKDQVDPFSKKLPEWREQKTTAFKAMEELREKHDAQGKTFDSEQRSNWDKAKSDYHEANKAIDAIRNAKDVEDDFRSIEEFEKAEQRSRKADPPEGNFGRGDRGDRHQRRSRSEHEEELRMKAFTGWMRRQSGLGVSREQKSAMQKMGYRSKQLVVPHFADGEMRSIQRQVMRGKSRDEIEVRGALSSGATATGGALVPTLFTRMLEIERATSFGLVAVATPLRTATGQEMSHPTASDSHKGRRLSENAATNNTNEPTFGNLTIGAFKYTSDMVTVPAEMLEDAGDQLIPFLTEALAKRIERITEEEYLYMDGDAGEPHGLIGDESNGLAQVGVTTLSTVGFTADDVKALKRSVHVDFRQGDRVGYMMNDAIEGDVELLKDSNGRYLWQDSLRDGTPAQLNGSRVFYNSYMLDTPAADKTIMMFGDFSKVVHRMVNNSRFYRLSERYRENDQEAFLMFTREDCKLGYIGNCPIKRMKTAAA